MIVKRALARYPAASLLERRGHVIAIPERSRCPEELLGIYRAGDACLVVMIAVDGTIENPLHKAQFCRRMDSGCVLQ